MRVSWTIAALVLCCCGSINGTYAEEQTLGLKGQLYFEIAPPRQSAQNPVPRHIPKRHVARAPIDFSYPETAASTGAHLVDDHTWDPATQSAWNMDLTDGAKLRFAYDKETKLSLGMGMWKVKVGVSKKFGGPSSAPMEWPERHGSAAGMGRIETGAAGPSSN